MWPPREEKAPRGRVEHTQGLGAGEARQQLRVACASRSPRSEEIHTAPPCSLPSPESPESAT